jgi:hypothetical protein
MAPPASISAFPCTVISSVESPLKTAFVPTCSPVSVAPAVLTLTTALLNTVSHRQVWGMVTGVTPPESPPFSTSRLPGCEAC